MYYGDIGKRIVASIIDGIIWSAVIILLGLLLGPVGIIISYIGILLCTIFMEGGSWHGTIGKRIMGLYIADVNGKGISYATSILRSIGKVFSGLLFCIGYLMACFNEEKQSLHDMIAKTYVLDGAAESAGGRRENVNHGSAARHAGSGDLPQLVGIKGPLAGMIYNVDENGLIIGRDSIGCQVVIPASQSKVSRVHCFITFNPISGMFVLNDRNSTHGTYLANGSKIPYAQPVALKSGEKFYLATPENTFEVR